VLKACEYCGGMFELGRRRKYCCKQCNDAALHRRNAEHENRRRRQYREKNREKCQEYERMRRIRDKDKILARKRTWRRKQPSKPKQVVAVRCSECGCWFEGDYCGKTTKSTCGYGCSRLRKNRKLQKYASRRKTRKKKTCDWCGGKYLVHGAEKTCSIECRDARHKAKRAEYNASDSVRKQKVRYTKEWKKKNPEKHTRNQTTYKKRRMRRDPIFRDKVKAGERRRLTRIRESERDMALLAMGKKLERLAAQLHI